MSLFPARLPLPGELRRHLHARLEGLSLPAFTLPGPVASVLGRLPQRPPARLLTTALNLALDRILPRAALEPLQGRQLQMRVLDAGLRLDFSLDRSGFRPTAPAERADLVISATLRDFIALALREEDADTLFFSRRLRMEGDTDLGLLVKNTLDAVDWDALREKFLLRLPPFLR